MITRRQALHYEPVLNLTSLLPISFLSFSQRFIGPPCQAATRAAIGLSAVLLAILSAVTLAWWRYHRRDYYLPAADWEEDLMPERGPAQLLLLFFRSRATPGWRLGLAVALLRCSAFCPARKCLPPGQIRYRPIVAPSRLDACPCRRAGAAAMAVGRHVTGRQFRRAAARPQCRGALTEAANAPSGGFSRSWRASRWRSDRHDPHLALGDVAIGDGLPVTAAEGLTPAYQVTGAKTVDDARLRPPMLRPPARAIRTLSCSRSHPSFAGALRLIIEAAHSTRWKAKRRSTSRSSRPLLATPSRLAVPSLASWRRLCAGGWRRGAARRLVRGAHAAAGGPCGCSASGAACRRAPRPHPASRARLLGRRRLAVGGVALRSARGSPLGLDAILQLGETVAILGSDDSDRASVPSTA